MAASTTYKGVTYQNGKVPKKFLAELDGENYGKAYLREDAAASWNRARAEVKAKTGITLTVRGWNRSYAEQVTFYTQRHAKWTAGYKVCCYWNGVPYRFTGTAHASPPGMSNHGWGIAVDVNDFGGVGNFNHPNRVKTIAILKKHGWTDTEGRGKIQEPWHLVYDPTKDTQKNATPTKPATPKQEEPDLNTTQAKQLSDIHAALSKLDALHAGTAPKIDRYDESGGEKITLRTAVKQIRLAVVGQLNKTVTTAVEKALANTTGVDKAAITKAVTAAVTAAMADAVDGTEYVMTPKETR